MNDLGQLHPVLSRFGETQHGVWGRYQLGRIKDHGEREQRKGSGGDQTEEDGEEDVEHLQPDRTEQSTIY